jgi:hypothetical protein
MKEQMFLFEIDPKQIPWDNKRPLPPKGYIEFNFRRNICPNCGKTSPGIGPSRMNSGFQNRLIQSIDKALRQKNRRLDMKHPNWKPSHESFSKDLIPELGTNNTMLNCHPSRYGRSKFYCCNTKIWHDFFHDGWKYYYLPTRKNNNSLQRWM